MFIITSQGMAATLSVVKQLSLPVTVAGVAKGLPAESFK